MRDFLFLLSLRLLHAHDKAGLPPDHPMDGGLPEAGGGGDTRQPGTCGAS
ncbi:hypothetical protein [Acetobacter senegalensis]|nr:hypothetical protein [Acetobacter senegalensis]MCG4258221.1 hypothetical protein [Acetobacter senegalensis]MCG4268148.1 hypothetical protein [Acetobacter senegalensis]